MKAILSKVSSKNATIEELEAIRYEWRLWARPEQIVEPNQKEPMTLICAGRGFGKTRAGAECIRSWAQEPGAGRIHLVAATAADARDVMIEGPSGILAVHPPHERPHYEPSKRRITWPNGRIATVFTADEPNRLRGPECEVFWADEIAAWRYVADAWSNLKMGNRVGNPRGIITTTPRPIPELKKLIENVRVRLVTGSTYDNKANLPDAFLEEIRDEYEGTRLGRQEIYAEMLMDVPGALWSLALIEESRVGKVPDCERVVVGVDPAASSDGAETGIVVCGQRREGGTTHGYVIEDVSTRGTPDEWATAAVEAYHEHGADRIVAEVNQGGDMVEAVIRSVDSSVSYKSVRATRGKVKRAEPIAALYEQRRIHHVGQFAKLEDQMAAFTPNEEFVRSPDRADALVWALTELFGKQQEIVAVPMGPTGTSAFNV